MCDPFCLLPLTTPQVNVISTAVITVPFMAYMALPVMPDGGLSGEYPLTLLVPALGPFGTRVRCAFHGSCVIIAQHTPTVLKRVELRTRQTDNA